MFKVVAVITFIVNVDAKISHYNDIQSNRLSDHTLVTDSNVFPYVVAVLKKQSYMSAGALLDDTWVLTAADPFFLVREYTRMVRVRLGSINYKKGGVLLPVKYIEVHPYFDDTKPVFDVALVRLADRVWLTHTLYPIRLQTKRKEVTATHFIVTAWSPSMKQDKQRRYPLSIDTIKQRRILSVSHLHPAERDICAEELSALDVTDTDVIMCLDSDLKSDPCWRDVGAPVVLNGILWGIISSWRPDNCRAQPGSNFVTLVAAPEVRSWVHATTRGHKWNKTEYVLDRSLEEIVNVSSDEDSI